MNLFFRQKSANIDIKAIYSSNYVITYLNSLKLGFHNFNN